LAVFFCSLLTDPLCLTACKVQMIDSVGVQQKFNING